MRVGGFTRVVLAEELAGHPTLAQLALGERAPLSAQLRGELATSSHSYTERDLVVVGYDQVLVVDPVSSSEIAILLEFALAQVVVLSAYDRLLDDRLTAARSGMSGIGGGRTWLGLGRAPFDALRHGLLLQQLELASVLEQVTAAVKVTEDFYYAKVYEAAMRVFRADELVQSTHRKLELMFRTYSMLADEHDSRTTHRLEWIVILLILFEVVITVTEKLF